MHDDGSGGFFLLLTESFAVRALFGSIVAGVLAWVIARLGLVRESRARRLLLLAPITAAVAAGLASWGEAFLPRLWVASTATGSAADQLLGLLGEPWFLTPQSGFDLLLLLYTAVVTMLLLRRVVGALAVRRLVTRSVPVSPGAEVVGQLGDAGPDGIARTFERLASQLGVPGARLRLLPGCPGGAFAAGLQRHAIVADPAVLTTLDHHEAEALLAHELAHVRRRDALYAVATGVVRDLTFFLPPVHVAAHWLRAEREESADELASSCTRRPGALASSILAVWERSATTSRPLACAAVPPRRGGWLRGRKAVARTSVTHVTRRVERLVQAKPAVGTWRRRVEVGLAAGVTAAAVVAAIAAPAWMVARHDAAALAVGYLQTPQEDAPESPAFATFRATASSSGHTTRMEGPADTPPAVGVAPSSLPGGFAPGGDASVLGGQGQPGQAPRPDDRARATEASVQTASLHPACPCVESRAQLRDGAPASVTDARRMVWAGDEREAWDLTMAPEGSSARETRTLWTVSDPGQQLGLFVLGAQAH